MPITNKKFNINRFVVHIAAGIILFAAVAIALPHALFSGPERISIACILLMVYWWITRPVHIAVTALVPIVVNSIFKMLPMGALLQNYADPIIVLLLGASLLAASWNTTGLDRRIAVGALNIIGTSLRGQLLVWFLLATLLSAFLPNTVVAAVLCPIAVAMFKFASDESQALPGSKSSFMVLLAIVWGAGIGGFGTPLGGAMNLVAINHIESYTGQEYMYAQWTIKMLPLLAALVAGMLIYFLLIRLDVKRLPGSREYFKSERKAMGRASSAQKAALALFLIAVLLSFTRPFYQGLLPEFKPPYAFLVLGLLLFVLPGDDNKPVLTWETASKNINWGLLILFAGGLAAGNALIGTGAAASLADAFSGMSITSPLALVLLFVVLGMFLSNASSNTAACAVLIPVVVGITAMLSMDVVGFVHVAAAACNCAFLLPTSIRAIPASYGLDTGFLFKKGLAAAAVSFAVLIMTGYIYIIF